MARSADACDPPSRERLAVLVFPRDSNPYQARLYGALASLGVRARYVGELTRSRSLGLTLLPLELLVWRRRGARILHIHWVFGFALTGTYENRAVRRASYLWYVAVLRLARVMGIRVVWTLHNVLPHVAVFPDDVRARRRLVTEASLVLAHSQGALDELAKVAGTPRRAHVVPHPRFSASASTDGRRNAFPRRALLFGQITAYKGVQETIRAFDEVAVTTTLALTVAGQCSDPSLRDALGALRDRHPDRVTLRLEHIPNAELGALFAEHDVQLLPYRDATTSGAAVLGAELGIPLAIADLPAFADVPGVRLGPGAAGLATSLSELDAISCERLDDLSARSAQWATAQGSWEDMARETERRFQEIVGVRGG